MNIIENIVIKPSPIKKIFKVFLIIFVLLLVFGVIIYFRVQTQYAKNIYEVESLPNDYQIVLVFGAGLKARGTPGAILEDRVLTAIKVYQKGKADYILMSGDNSQANHNEVRAMENLALKKGLDSSVIVLDHAGLSTFDSCYRARHEFGAQKVILVTQSYHLRRALYVCNKVGLDAIGVEAGKKKYNGQMKFMAREILASVADWFEVIIKK